MTTKRKKWLIAGCIVVAAAGGWMLLHPSKHEGITLETAPTSRITISNSVTATGTVEPVTEVEVGTQVSGIIDRRVVCYAEYDRHFKAGEQIGFIKFGSRADVFLAARPSTSTSSRTTPARTRSTKRSW